MLARASTQERNVRPDLATPLSKLALVQGKPVWILRQKGNCQS